MDARHVIYLTGVLFSLFAFANGCQYCGCYGTPNCDCYCPPWMYIGYDRIILEPARGQVSVSSSAAASVKYNKGAPQAYISSLSSAKADPKIPVNIVGMKTTPAPTGHPAGAPTAPPHIGSSVAPTKQSSSKAPSPGVLKHDWGYRESPMAYGPKSWTLISPKCGGMRQSPIDINTASITRAQIPLSITSNSGGAGVPDPLIVSGKLNNNGRAIGFTINSEKTPVKLKFKGVAFTLKQFHFHFGCEGDMGSEHAIDGKRFPGEIHLIFANDNFALKEALQHKSGLLGMAFFMRMDPTKNNTAMQRITNHLETVKMPHSSVEIPDLSLKNLIPLLQADLISNLQSYAYQGSLPSPPCFESVTWLVSEQLVSVKPDTLTKWRQTLQGKQGPLCGNFRPVQPLNDRKIIDVLPIPEGTTPTNIGPTQAPSVPPAVQNKAHLPADTRQELHPEPLDSNKLKNEDSSKPQSLGVPVQGLNPAFAKVGSNKDSTAMPEAKKGIEIAKQQAFNTNDAGLSKNNMKQDKKPTVAPGMRRQIGV